MKERKIDFDYTNGVKPFREECWINIRSGKREWIRLPYANSMRELPLTPYHVSEPLYNLWLSMGSCKLEIDLDNVRYD